ncbi:hypothetical protein HMI55_007274 [Coelomomyces lativittatus]|nr:hypothetical protein HMI55_007274 [Coelomomyces lativittatus]
MTQRGFTMLFKDTPPPSTWIPSSSVGLLPTPERMALLKANLTRVQAQIEQTCSSCHRSTEEVCLVAVSKHMPVHDIYALYQLGHRHFGENYVHELLEKAVQVNLVNIMKVIFFPKKDADEKGRALMPCLIDFTDLTLLLF